MKKRPTPRTLSVILGGGKGTRLSPLTLMRAKPAVPLGGKYRLIDVPISNCINSGLNQIYVVTQFESASLHTHVKGAYQFDRFNGGFVEILAANQGMETNDWYQGTADAVRRNLHHFGDRWDEMLILSGDQLYHMDFELLLNAHREAGAQMTIAVLPVDAENAASLGIVRVTQNGRVVGFVEKPPIEAQTGLETDPALFRQYNVNPAGRPFLASMGIYIFDRKVIYEELASGKYVDFGKDLFPYAVKNMHVQAYVFDGYWEDIGTVKAFHEANLGMALNPPLFPLQSDKGTIYTRPRTLAPTIARRLQLTDSLVADGCKIDDAVLENSVVGLRSVIGAKVHLKRTMMMGADYYETEAELADNRRLGRPNVGIGDNVVIENAIVDKNVRIGDDVVIRNPDSVKPIETAQYVVRDGVICIIKGAAIKSGSRIGV
ncbi:MAG: glucose-1-phosphate adenylyltransferase [Planctomycetia bacterium]